MSECSCSTTTAEEFYCSECHSGTCDQCGVVCHPKPSAEDDEVWVCGNC